MISDQPSKDAKKLNASAAAELYQDFIEMAANVPEDSLHYSAYGEAIARISRECIARQFNISQYMTRPFTPQDHLVNRIAAFWELGVN